MTTTTTTTNARQQHQLNRSRNQLLHNFITTTINGLDSCIHERATHGVFLHVSPTTMKLYTDVCSLELKISQLVFCHGSHLCRQLVFLEKRETGICKGTSDCDFRFEFRKLVFYRLKIGKCACVRVLVFEYSS